jgi:hypothetical protein
MSYISRTEILPLFNNTFSKYGNVFLFDVPTGEKVMIYKSGLKEEVVIKFS